MWRRLPANALKNGWDQVDGENGIVGLPFPHPLTNAKAASHRWIRAYTPRRGNKAGQLSLSDQRIGSELFGQ